MTNGNTLLCTDLSIWPTLDNPGLISDAIYASPLCKQNLINRLLLYDQIIIPTGNLLILPVLRLWLGDVAVCRLLEEEIVILTRYDSWLCYAGNGGGLKFFQILPGTEPHAREHNIGTLFYAPLDELVARILKITNPPTPESERKNLETILLSKVRPLSLNRYEEKLRIETYTDVIKSPMLRSFFAIRNTDLSRLHGIGPNQVQFGDFQFARAPDKDKAEINAVLRIAFENLLLTFASETATTLQADISAEKVLRAKGQRLGLGDAQLDGFLSILNVGNVPNMGAAFASGEVSFDRLMKLREGRQAKDFRRWLSAVDPLNKEDIVRAYVHSLGEKSTIQRLPAKLLRFVTTSLLGMVPGLGAAASFVDSFLLEKWFPGRSPTLFLDEIRHVVVKAQQHSRKGSQRNDPCPCGSGKKYKKCCWDQTVGRAERKTKLNVRETLREGPNSPEPL